VTTAELEAIARAYAAENSLTLHEQLLLSHFVGVLRLHTQGVVQPTAAVVDNKRSWSLLKGG